MKAKKYGIIVSVVLIVISLFTAIILECISDNQFFINILLGIFGSGFVTLVIYISEYLVEKRKALETYYLCILETINEFNKIEYFDMQPPIDLIKKYFHEEFVNKRLEHVGRNHSHKKSEELIDYYIYEYKSSNWETSDIERMAQEKLEYESLEYSVKLQKTIDSYLTFIDYSFASTEAAYGNLDFFFANKKFRKWIYTDIHIFVREKLADIKEIAFHFNLYCKGKGGSKGVMIDYIEKVQKDFFVIETREDDTYINRYVKPKFINILEDHAEELRAKIYNQQNIKIIHSNIFQQSSLKNKMKISDNNL